MNRKKNCCAIVVAAGNSTRMGMSCSKQFVLLNKIPAIVHTLLAFQNSDCITSVVLVCCPGDRRMMEQLIQRYQIQKLYAVIPGGDTRQQSVMAGILAAPEETEYYAIHDGARALITPKEIMAAVRDGVRYGASALAVPVKDTIKMVNRDGFVCATPERSMLWAVQTPQVFEKGLYQKAMACAQAEGADYTDDCQLAEHAGIPVHLCMGAYTNIKLTTAEDIPAAQAILQKRECLSCAR